jgi:ATP-dependent DNA helicase DinG
MTVATLDQSCPHGVSQRNGGWTLVDNEWDRCNGLWVHGDPNCWLPSRATLDRIKKSSDSACETQGILGRLAATPERPEETPMTATAITTRPTTFAEAEQVLAQALPGYESRPQQQALAAFVEKTLAEGGHALAEAGCGTGKSLGSMIPAILSGKRTVVATATIALMEQYANKDVPFLAEHLGVDFTWALLKGRSNYFCWAKATSPSERVSPALVASLQAELEANPEHTGDREHFATPVSKEEFSYVSSTSADCPGRAKCPFGDICFAEQAKRKAADSQVVITNTAMLMTDLKVRQATEGYGSMLGEFDALILDEAHELEEIATNQLEDTFRPSNTTLLVKDVQTFMATQGTVYKGERRLLDATDAVMAALPDPGKEKVRLGLGFFVGQAENYIEMIEALRETADAIADVTIQNGDRKKETSNRMRLLSRTYNLIRRFQTLATSPDEDLVRWVQDDVLTRSTVRSLHSAPINVGPFLREWLWDQVPAVLVSATLSVGGDFSFVKDRLGLADATTMNVGTPFDYTTQAMLFVPDAKMPSPKQRAAWMTYSATATMELIDSAKGGALLLFTSRSAMTQAYRDLGPRLEAKGFTTLAQGVSGTNKEIAKTFAEDTHSVLFALKSFFTGVDIPGEACRLVVIDKLPFPVPSEPVFQARADEIKRAGGSDFSDLSVPMMTLTLTQGFGRLIRTKTDRGVVAILDSRLTATGYGKKIVRSLPGSPSTTSLDSVREFYAG